MDSDRVRGIGPQPYNQHDVLLNSSLRKKAWPVCVALALSLVFVGQVRGQNAADAVAQEAANAGRGRILLVLPFDNRTGQPSLEWIREAAAEILSQRFASAGFAPMNRTERLYALDHLGLPEGGPWPDARSDRSFRLAYMEAHTRA
jgi:hypothetical protein